MCYNDAMKRNPGPFADGAQFGRSSVQQQYKEECRMVVKCNVW